MAKLLTYLFILPIKLYRYTLSAFLGRTCRYAPTCSDYAEQAILRHGPWTGGWLALKRLSRCHPWGGDGFDPVPEHPQGTPHDPPRGTLQ